MGKLDKCSFRNRFFVYSDLYDLQILLMAKLIEKVQPGMTMEQVRKIIPYKPYSIVGDYAMNQQIGKTTWIYLNSKGTLRIFFENGIYTHHSITPNLAEMDRLRELEN